VIIRQQIRPESELHYGTVTLPEDLPQGNYRLRAYTRFMENRGEDYFYTRYFHIADPQLILSQTQAEYSGSLSGKKEFHVSFYPEGGYLVAGHLSKMAFQVQSSDGRNIDSEGVLLDSKSDTIMNLNTIHDGMGYFIFAPESGEHYHALINNKRFELPDSFEDIYSLKTVWRERKLWISTNKTRTTNQAKYLIIHSKGNVYYAEKWNEDMNLLVFEQEEFPSGISHILLFTEDYQIISERLIFNINEKEEIKVPITTTRGNYRKRERVEMDIAVKDINGNNVKSNFALSITDDKDIQIDTTNTIESTILLTSELRGEINNPVFYLDPKHSVEADLLMMIHGWTRYNIPKAMRGDFQYPAIPYEQSQSLSGTVKGGLFSKPYEGAKISLLSIEHGYYDIAETDRNGDFIFECFEFPDNTTFYVQALSKKLKSAITLHLKTKSYPEVTYNPKYTQKIPDLEPASSFRESVEKAEMKYTIEHGMRIHNLDEVTIHGTRKYQDEEHRYSGLSRIITEKEIVTGGTDMISLIRRLGIRVLTGVRNKTTGEIQDVMYIRGNMIPVPDELRNLDIYDLQAIGIAHTPGGPRIVPILKPFDERIKKQPKYNVATITPLGYQLPVEFYSPKYAIQDEIDNPVPDLRSTIYWKPDVITDSAGKATLDFYTADSPSTYSVIIEGITEDGKLIYKKSRAFVKVE
jgi:hypothetical protein